MTYSSQRKIPKVPTYLVKEILDNMPVFYKGYKAVLRKEKTVEDIMGASGLQIFIVRYLFRLLDRNLDENLFYVFTGEVGLHINKGNNLSGDVLVFERQTLTPDLIDTHYLNIPPLIDIEVDIEIDNSTFSDFDYIQRKTDNLLKFGTEKVIWILTKSQKIIVAEPNKDWLMIDWQKDVEITNGITFNVPQYLKKEGVFIFNDRMSE
jgi:Uma2 family endonuclease